MLDTRVTAAVVLPVVHVFSTQTVAEFYRRHSNPNLDKTGLLYLREDAADIKPEAKAFLDKYKDAELPLINQLECALLRTNRKNNVLNEYPRLRERIAQEMQSAPELVKFVLPPSALNMTYAAEVDLHHRTFVWLKLLPDAELRKLLEVVLTAEAAIENEFWAARKALSGWETQVLGFETYGHGGRHYFFRNVLHNLRIEPRPDMTPGRPAAGSGT